MSRRPAPTTAEIDALAQEVARRALVQIAAALSGAIAEPPFTTRRSGPRPAGIGLRRWQKLAPGVPGAVRRGRYWTISRADYAAWERGSNVMPAAPANDAAWSPASALAAAGLRGQR